MLAAATGQSGSSPNYLRKFSVCSEELERWMFKVVQAEIFLLTVLLGARPATAVVSILGMQNRSSRHLLGREPTLLHKGQPHAVHQSLELAKLPCGDSPLPCAGCTVVDYVVWLAGIGHGRVSQLLQHAQLSCLGTVIPPT